MFEGYIAEKLANKMFEKEVFKIIKRHAAAGAIVMMLPLLGLDWIIYCVVLWHMYYAICEKLDTELNFSNIAIGFFVNIIIAIILDLIFTFLPFLTAFIVYAQFYLSGKAFVESLKAKSNL